MRNLFSLYNKISANRMRKSSLWVEDVFLPVDDADEARHTYVGNGIKKGVVILMTISMIVVSLVLYGRVVWMQVVKGEEYNQMAEDNRTRHVAISAERGIIFDRHHVALLSNKPRFSVNIRPADVQKISNELPKIAEFMSSIVHAPYEEILDSLTRALQSTDREVMIRDHVTQHEAIALSVADTYPNLFSIVTSIERSYEVLDPHINSLSHIIGYEAPISPEEYEEYKQVGYLKTDYRGKQGIELSYENELRGKKGDRVFEVNAEGQGLNVLREIKPQKGNDVTLTIDAELQRVAENALYKKLTSIGKTRGVVIVQATQTGELLALVNAPSYSNEKFGNGFQKGEYEKIQNDGDYPLLNRAIAGLYPSGSVIKPIIAFAALSEKIITPQTTIVSSGGLQVSKWFFPDWKAGGHGRVNVREAIANSVNTFFYIIGGGFQDREGLGIDRIERWLAVFGFGELSGVKLSGEQVGVIPTPAYKEKVRNERWYIGDTYNTSIGQGDFLTTPLQITNAISAIANGGKLFVPSIVRAIENIPEAASVKRMVNADEYVFETVRRGMRETVIYGSARSLSDIPLDVAGKTGTAQWSGNALPHAWFVGFAPFKQPEITVTVLIEEGGEGSSVAVPVAREIFVWWSKHNYSLN